MCAWLLYTASVEAEFKPRKWRQYLPQNKGIDEKSRLSIAQTRHAAEELFLTFDASPFKPQKSKSGKPRKKGDTQKARTRYKVVKKNTQAARKSKKE